MGAPLFLVENFFSTVQFPAHTLVADEEAAGHEVGRIANGRRSGFDYWTSVTANVQRTITGTCDRVRTADTLWLDRGHNLAGKTLILEASQDNFVSPSQVVFNFTVPTVSVGGDMTTAPGVVTEEGCFLFTFPAVAATYWRLRIPGLGAGIVPLIVGAILGRAYVPAGTGLLLPWGEDTDELVVKEIDSEWAWKGRGPIANRRAGTIGIKLSTDDDYDLARYHLAGHFGRGRPMVIVYDQQQADRAFLAIRPSGPLGFQFEPSWWPRQVRMPYLEHEPLRAA